MECTILLYDEILFQWHKATLYTSFCWVEVVSFSTLFNNSLWHGSYFVDFEKLVFPPTSYDSFHSLRTNDQESSTYEGWTIYYATKFHFQRTIPSNDPTTNGLKWKISHFPKVINISSNTYLLMFTLQRTKFDTQEIEPNINTGYNIMERCCIKTWNNAVTFDRFFNFIIIRVLHES